MGRTTSDTRQVVPIRGDKSAAGIRPDRQTWLNSLTRSRKSGPHLSDHQFTGMADQTLAVHAGSGNEAVTGCVGTPIYQSTTFLLNEDQYRSVGQGYARDRFIYTRYGNPSQWSVQEKLAALEGAESSVVFSSGMAAISTTLLTLLDPGGHVVASNELYGGTYNFLNLELPNVGMSATLVDPRDYDAIEAAIRPNTQVLYFETITNPLLKVVDLRRLGDIAERRGVRLVVDATFSTPIVTKPLEYGVDIVVHSATKYLNGHSDLVAGVAAGSRKLIDQVWARMLNFGGCLDPHACFLLERGLKTLAVRMRAHAETALAVATHLEAHPQVRRVFHPMLETHPDHALAKELMRCGTGNVTFEVEGGDTAALDLVGNMTLARSATSLGGVESLVSLPFNSSHSSFTASQRAEMGIMPGCVRLSVGIEDPADLIADLDQAFDQIRPAREASA
jgi:cystathionine beta-lyase/cystathionine gamma-synthase